jgi:hypothetical protein
LAGQESDQDPGKSVTALMLALLGSETGMKGGPYKLLKHLRIWKSKIGDEGAIAIVRPSIFLFYTVG